MTGPWSADPGAAPPTTSSLPPGWGTTTTAPTGPPTVGAGPPLPDLQPPEPPRAPNATAIVIASLAVVIVLLVGVLAWVWARTGDTVATAPLPTTTTAPATTSTTKAPSTTTPSSVAPSTTKPPTPSTTAPTGPVPTQAEVEAVVREISAFDERQRGLTFKEPVKVELLPDDQFDEQLLKDFDKEKADIEKMARIFKALGIIDENTDMAATMKSLLTAGVLGFYDPETKQLVVRGRQLTPFTKQTIAHELVHALDGQYFDLVRKDLDDAKDESGFGFSAVVEGNARRIENAYVAAMSPADKASRDREEAKYGAEQMDVLTGIPPILLSLLQAPYELGPVLDQRIIASGGNDALADAFVHQPTTSSQVIHPEKFLAKQGAVAVAKPAAEGKETDDGMFGELATVLVLSEVANAQASQAGDGWAGDWYVVWDQPGGGSCIRIDYKMATDKDRAELEQTYQLWAKSHQGATIEKKGDLLEVTRCSGGGGGGQSKA